MLAGAALAAPETYILDRNQSRVGFTYDRGDQQGKGFFPVQSAEVTLDLERVQNSMVDVTLSVKEARAGDLFSTSAMKSAEVLNADRFPIARFKSTQVRREGQGVEIDGQLTLRGTTRPATVQARILRRPDAPKDNSELVLEITGGVNRFDFGATGYPNFVGDQIGLKFFVWLNRATR